jgi:hypothetical protein
VKQYVHLQVEKTRSERQEGLKKKPPPNPPGPRTRIPTSNRSL